jgi:cytochrome c-type biogenesis protein CcmH
MSGGGGGGGGGGAGRAATITRRDFIAASSAAFATAAFARLAGAQQTDQEVRMTMSGPMDEGRYRPVSRPPKPNATPSMTDLQRDELERGIHCMCGCTLDIYTCRTTDFTCPVSPSMHADVVRLVAGGYPGPEILAAFVLVYGERVLMSPPRAGFNWAAYLAPFVALGAGGILVAALVRHWRPATASTSQGTELDRRSTAGPTAPLGDRSTTTGATPEEKARLEAAIHDDMA